MNPAWFIPINTAHKTDRVLSEDIANKIGPIPLAKPNIKNNLPLVTLLRTPAMNIEDANAPAPTPPIRYVIPIEP